ncbi:c-type cytochrome [Oryzisolibacter sp. LB2S]|uniref:c-type cytochrome n=1 Tax=Alicycliphilus soli TaxID=3228789 RepID=UPI0034575BDA
MRTLSFYKLFACSSIALAAIFSLNSQAIERVAPQVDTTALPPQAATWQEPNPLRGNAQAAAIGQIAFNQSCARCHGQDANGSRSPAPDLRRISKGCRRIQDEALRERCLADGDAFFIKSVRYGKQKFGIVHMPPWEGVISPELAWALRSFVETAPAR